MKQSKLELYIEILKTLNQRSPNSNNGLNEVKIDCNAMKDRMEFLIKQRLVTQSNCGIQGVFKNTIRGKNVLNYFNELKNREDNVDLDIKIADYQKRRQML